MADQTSAGSAGSILAGVRIVEISGIGPGPFCGMHLADLGADVIAVERPDAAAARTAVYRGKRSVVADLKSAEGRGLVLRLIEDADGLIEGMRPGVMERLGLGPDPCSLRNPRLVYGRMTGWGQTGPLSQVAGHDNNYAALSGALYFNGTAAEPPTAALSLLGDVGGGALYLVIGMLAGILRARSTGKGCVVDASMVDGSAHMLQLLLGSQQKGMTTERRGGNMHDSSHFFATYRCSDGEFISLAAIEPQFYALLLEKLALSNDERFANQWDSSRWSELRAELAKLFAGRTRAEWTSQLEGSDVCFAPVLRPQEAAAHPHNAFRRTYFERGGLLQTAAAPRFDGEVVAPGPIPSVGEHTASVLEAMAGADAKSVWRKN